MPSKKLSADMFFGDNPNEYDINYFNYLNNLTKKDLIKIYIKQLGLNSKEFCNKHIYSHA